MTTPWPASVDQPMPEQSVDSGATIRRALPEDKRDLERHIAMSVRVLAAEHHSPDEIDSSLRYLFGVDSTLIDDGTYYLAERAGEILACGGWSRRKTPFGGDRATKVQDDAPRDPSTDPALIRAFFVAPHAVRKGLGRKILAMCEEECLKAGFASAELVATRMGRAFYAACGYTPEEPLSIDLPDGVRIDAVRMKKNLSEQ